MGLPNGPKLLTAKSVENSATKRWQEFLDTSRRTKRFVVVCNQWRQSQRASKASALITTKQVEAFDFMFGRGILAAARDELVQRNNTWALQYINITLTEIIQLLIRHGANPLERDVRGTTLLPCAAGTGNLDAMKELLPYYFPSGLLDETERDGATPLHWATAGVNSKEFGTGGHLQICQFLLLECDQQRRLQQLSGEESSAVPTAEDLVICRTKDGNSPLMWAAWSESLDTVKLMVRHRAIWQLANTNGCTVAHWASSGGNLEVCKYLHDVVGVDFFVPNHGGNTPLTHAVAFGRVEVVRWLREVAVDTSNEDNDILAAQLAEDFVEWSSELTSSAVIDANKRCSSSRMIIGMLSKTRTVALH
jgi:ankyrin repeat protein